MSKKYSTTLIVTTIALSIIIGIGLLFLIFTSQPVSCEDLGLPTTCTQNSDCGPTGFFGQPYCSDGNVWQGFYQSTCTGIQGTCDSFCESNQGNREVMKCNNGCAQGRCLD